MGRKGNFLADTPASFPAANTWSEEMRVAFF